MLDRIKNAFKLPIDFYKFGFELKLIDIRRSPTATRLKHHKYPKVQMWGDGLRVQFSYYVLYMAPAGAVILTLIAIVLLIVSWLL